MWSSELWICYGASKCYNFIGIVIDGTNSSGDMGEREREIIVINISIKIPQSFSKLENILILIKN
jgi:hypothetical protein